VLSIGIRVVLFIKGLTTQRDGSKGKGIVIDDNEKEIVDNNEPKGEPIDSSSNNKRKDGKKKRCIKKIVYHDSDASSSSPKMTTSALLQRKRRSTNITPLIIPAFRTTPMLIYCLFLLASPSFLWGRLFFLES
jgi:hypothetical protein